MVEIILNCITPLILTTLFSFIAKELGENRKDNKGLNKNYSFLFSPKENCLLYWLFYQSNNEVVNKMIKNVLSS